MNFHSSLGLLLLRVSFSGIMIIAHGLPKVMNPAPFIERLGDMGVPLPLVSGYLAIAAETIFPLLIIIGIFARISAFIAAVNMFVAAFVVHMAIQGDPFSKFELATLYMIVFGVLAITGPGGFSVTSLFGWKESASQ